MTKRKTPVRAAQAAVDRLARVGLIAKGAVYVLFGGLVSYAALTGRRRVTDEQGTVTTLFQQPFGKFLLAALAVGLAAYALWRLVELIFNPQKTEGFWSARAKPLLSAIVYGGLAVEAVRMILGQSRGGEGEGSTREQAAMVMSLPLGHWLLVAFGAILLATASYELWKNITGEKKPEARPPGETVRRWNERLSRFGESSRSIIGLVAGGYLILGALNRSPGEVRGSQGALEKISEQPFGRWLLLIAALGLVFYGIVQWINARYAHLAKKEQAR